MQIKWLSREQKLHDPSLRDEGGNRASPSRHRRLAISLLTFGTFERCTALLSNLCELLKLCNELPALEITIVVRNNNPRLDSSQFDREWKKFSTTYAHFRFLLFNDGENIGYGNGHNCNFDACPCDYFLVLNDDIALRDVDWLVTALAIMENDKIVAGVGASNSPGSITPFYANGALDRQWHRWPLKYIEGSIAVLRSSVFTEVGKFDPAYEWALCEDSDLSFRIQAIGYRLEWIEIPHEHWRGSSLNSLPGQVKASILEHNRSIFFSKWNVSIAQNRIGRFQVFDLWSDGLGDVLVSSLHLKGYVDTLNDTLRGAIIVNTSWPDLVRSIFGQDVIVQSISDRQRLVSAFSEFGVRSLNSIRELNYGLPFNLHALVCGALGIPIAKRRTLLKALDGRHRTLDGSPLVPLPKEPYCVVHLESERSGHDGRSPSPTVISLIASVAAAVFPKLVLVGRTKHLAFDEITNRAGLIDLRGRLSISSLIDVIGGADSFVGLDSFPAHVAQVFGIRSVLFFGSIHPAFRILAAGQTWPITKDIDCIGCYHTAIEPVTPYCLRRDLSCTKEIDRTQIRAVMESCAELEAFDWRDLEARALDLQQRFLTKMFFHPDPQRRFFSLAGTPQLATTGLIEMIIEQVREHLLPGGHHHSIAEFVSELNAAKQEIYRKDMQIESMVKLIGELRAEAGRTRRVRPRRANGKALSDGKQSVIS